MPRPNPLNRRLPKDWREATLKILEIAVCPPGSASRPIISGILAHPKTEEAIKYLLDASEGSTPSYMVVIAQAFGGCMIAKESERLRRKNTSKSEATYKTIKRLMDDAMTIAGQLPTHEFSIYDRASSLYPDTFKKLDNSTILNALTIAGGMADALAYQPKRSNTGRPIDLHRKVLVISLADLFRKHFGTTVSGAVAGLVSATFPDRPALTGKAVRDMLSKK